MSATYRIKISFFWTTEERMGRNPALSANRQLAIALVGSCLELGPASRRLTTHLSLLTFSYLSGQDGSPKLLDGSDAPSAVDVL